MHKSSRKENQSVWALALHGGVGDISQNVMSAEEAQKYKAALSQTLSVGKKLLSDGRSSLDVVEKVVKMLEDSSLFNAGKGAVMDAAGEFTLDASIMDGSTLKCGAVALVRNVKNPVKLARLVMEQTPWVMLGGEGAEDFANEMRVDRVRQEYFAQRQWKMVQQKNDGKWHIISQNATAFPGTVGCVALDRFGNIASATSTEGVMGKRKGRIGDSAIIGAGTYASNAGCAVSCTGAGEEFIRFSVASKISLLIEECGLSLEDAAQKVVFKNLKPGDGGVIAIDNKGNVVMPYNTRSMLRATASSSQGSKDVVAI